MVRPTGESAPSGASSLRWCAIARAATSIAGLSRKLSACCCEASSDRTSRSRASSPAHEWLRKESRSPGARSNAACNRLSTRFHRSESIGCSAGQFAIEPRLGGAPIAHHGDGRHFEHFGSLFHAESAKEAHFDHLHFAWIERFFDHMLELFAKHGGFDLKLDAKGDLDVDQHHTVEDVGIVLGQLFAKALGDRRGINRAGYFVLPMDETLAVVALDLGGRPALVYRDLVRVRLVGDLQTELVEDFFGGFVNHAGANLHARVLYGRSNRHNSEAVFKCFARALKYACSTDRRLRGQLPSTKGLL